VDFYNHVMGFHQTHQEDIVTDYSGMNSKVVQNRRGPIKFPIMEPADGRRKSQIEEYLAFYGGPGAQHLAVVSDDIIGTVRTLRDNGIEFLRTPATYYETLEQRVGKIEEDVEALRELCILADLDDSGYLLQIFSKPLGSRPTIFLEVIQRKGAQGFGGGNIKALFEAVEREQSRRGNL
jgi:4-hydroxyphenylpyruvate dioxygenase